MYQRRINDLTIDVGNTLHKSRKILYAFNLNMGIKERLIEFIKYLETTPKAFERDYDFSNGFVRNIGFNLSEKSINKLKAKFTDLNINWLMTGEGLMISHSEENADTVNQADTNKDPSDGDYVVTPEGKITSRKQNLVKSNALIPFYNLDFMAGNAIEFYQDSTIYPDYYMDVPEFYGCTAFRAYSDSMEEKIRSGNILFATKLEDWQSHLEYGQIYGITCKDGRRYLKYIRVNTTDRTQFLLKSQNPNYDDFTLPISKINNLWLIQGWLDRRT